MIALLSNEMAEEALSSVDQLFLPGEIVEDLKDIDEQENKVVLGPGLRVQEKQVLVTKPGILRFKECNTYWIDCHQRRYVPVRGDHVLGICTMKAGDIFRVDIGSNEPAGLSFLSFEGSNKRNRPDVKVGDLLYGKILIANKDMESELVCINSQGKSAGMGVIRDGGFLFTCPLHLARKLLNPQCILLKSLGKNIQFEVAIGMNGRVWIKAVSGVNTIAVANAIASAEHMTNNQIKVMCQRLSQALETHSKDNSEPKEEDCIL